MTVLLSGAQVNAVSVLMTTDIDRIKFELLSACASGMSVDIASWVARFPEYRDELLDFWLWARGIDQGDPDPPEGPSNLPSLMATALRRACLAVSLGAEWLTPLAAEAECYGILEQLLELRKEPPPKVPRARRAFRRAVVCAWVVEELSTVRSSVTRLTLQKTTHLLERAMTLKLFDEHRKKSLGPYDHTARYKDAEPIAAKKGWIVIVGNTFLPGERGHEFQQYASRYLRSPDLASRLARFLGRLSDDQLETWATIEWVARDLSASRAKVTVDNIRDAINRDRVWASKLQKPSFSEDRICEAMQGLGLVGLLPKT